MHEWLHAKVGHHHLLLLPLFCRHPCGWQLRGCQFRIEKLRTAMEPCTFRSYTLRRANEQRGEPAQYKPELERETRGLDGALECWCIVVIGVVIGGGGGGVIHAELQTHLSRQRAKNSLAADVWASGRW